MGNASSTDVPSNLKERMINLVDENMIEAYHDPIDIFTSYVTKIVNASRTKEFLQIPPNFRPEATHRAMTDLGLEYDIGPTVTDHIRNLEHLKHLKEDDLDRVVEVYKARFSARGHSQLLSDVKNITYISVLGNFGATITQAADAAFAIHFNGLGPTFKAWFDRNPALDFYKKFGLESCDVDLESSRDGLSKVLNTVLTMTGFKQLDKFGKNTVMKGAFFRMKNLAKNNPDKLFAELEPKVGRDNANKIMHDVLSDDPFTDLVEGAIWSRLLDLQPAGRSEMTMLQSAASGLPSGAREVVGAAYWLKTFTIKQWDVFIEENNGKVGKSIKLWKAGKKDESVKLASEAMTGITGLAVVFGAMNMGTSAFKDVMYGRQTNMDELRNDTLLRLMGGSRYHMWRARREGIFKAGMEFFMPATTALDRAGKDLISLASGDAPVEVYRGIGVGDFYYWRYGGGREKTRKDLAKRTGLPLKHIPK